MSLTYGDAAALLFGEEEFSVAEFRRRTGNPRAAKVLSELKQRGLVERVARGRYRCLRQSERPDLRSVEWAQARRAILDGPDPKAWTGPTAVEVWTGGRYTWSRSPLARDLYVAIEAGSAAGWIEHLGTRGVPVEPRKRIGARVHLVPRGSFHAVVWLDGEPVIPRAEVERLIREHPGLYADAEDLLVDPPG